MSEAPRLPRLPDAEVREPLPTEDARNLATYFALIVLLGFGLGFVFLVALMMPDLLFALLAIAIIPLYFLFHYVVWGRLMQPRPDDDDSPDL